MEASLGDLWGLEQPHGTDICLVLKWGQSRGRSAGGMALPIHTSPNWPAPSRSTSFRVSLGTSHSSSHHGFWGFWVWQGRLNRVHSPSEVSMRSREGRRAVNKAELGGGGLTQSPPGEMDRQGLSPDP